MIIQRSVDFPSTHIQLFEASTSDYHYTIDKSRHTYTYTRTYKRKPIIIQSFTFAFGFRRRCPFITMIDAIDALRCVFFLCGSE